MRLTNHSDYALRTLIFLACNPGQRVTTAEISSAYQISHHHLLKIVNHLGQLGLIDVHRGKNGGLCLARDPSKIFVGQVLRTLEQDTQFVECFDEVTDQCAISPSCSLKAALARALEAFYEALDPVDLASIVRGKRGIELRKLLRSS